MVCATENVYKIHVHPSVPTFLVHRLSIALDITFEVFNGTPHGFASTKSQSICLFIQVCLP